MLTTQQNNSRRQNNPRNVSYWGWWWLLAQRTWAGMHFFALCVACQKVVEDLHVIQSCPLFNGNDMCCSVFSKSESHFVFLSRWPLSPCDFFLSDESATRQLVGLGDIFVSSPSHTMWAPHVVGDGTTVQNWQRNSGGDCISQINEFCFVFVVVLF